MFTMTSAPAARCTVVGPTSYQMSSQMFTPTLMYFPQTVEEGQTAVEAAVATVPGAFGPATTFHMMKWIVEKGYEGDETFQKYHARMLVEEEE